MPKVTVCYFTKYDIKSDEMIRSKRMATLEKIAELHAVPLRGNDKEVDTSDLDPNGFYPKKKQLRSFPQ